MDFRMMDKLTEEVWGKWISIPFAFIVFSILGIVLYAPVSNYTPAMTWLIIVLMIGLFIWYSVFVFLRNNIKKARKSKVGILVSYDAANHEVYREAERKFGDIFSEKLFSDFDVISAPYGVTNKINFGDKNSITKLLCKKRCVLCLKIRLDYDTSDKEVFYEMRINAGVLHRKYPSEVEHRYARTISEALKEYREVTFNSKEMIKKLKVTAEEISLACEYLIGLSFYLNGDFYKAEEVLCVLSKRVPQNSNWEKVAFFVQNIRYEMFMVLAGLKGYEYQNHCDEEKLLNEFNDYLEKANACKKNTYEYNLNNSNFALDK